VAAGALVLAGAAAVALATGWWAAGALVLVPGLVAGRAVLTRGALPLALRGAPGQWRWASSLALRPDPVAAGVTTREGRAVAWFLVPLVGGDCCVTLSLEGPADVSGLPVAPAPNVPTLGGTPPAGVHTTADLARRLAALAP
jgi:hypothetical protein